MLHSSADLPPETEGTGFPVVTNSGSSPKGVDWGWEGNSSPRLGAEATLDTHMIW